jgi:hypothetical protein
MKSTTYEALKTFDTRLHMAFPGATFRLIEPFEGYDVAVEVTLPIGKVTWHDRMQLAEITAALEEEYDVYIGLLTKTVT